MSQLHLVEESASGVRHSRASRLFRAVEVQLHSTNSQVAAVDFGKQRLSCTSERADPLEHVGSMPSASCTLSSFDAAARRMQSTQELGGALRSAPPATSAQLVSDALNVSKPMQLWIRSLLHHRQIQTQIQRAHADQADAKHAHRRWAIFSLTQSDGHIAWLPWLSAYALHQLGATPLVLLIGGAGETYDSTVTTMVAGIRFPLRSLLLP